MNPCAPGPSSMTSAPSARPTRRRRSGVLTLAVWAAFSLALHAGLLFALMLTLPGRSEACRHPGYAYATFRRGPGPQSVIPIEVEEYDEVVCEYETVAEEPVIKDEVISDHVAIDGDVAYAESDGQTALGLGGVSDGPWQGPACNSTYGIGGGAGGAFKGRGGSRDLGCGGGGRAAPAQGGVRRVQERVHRTRRCFRTEGYDRIRENPFLRVRDEDISTFSVDVDTASYANVRRFLKRNRRLPPKDAVRIEEMLNYFPYAYPPPPAHLQAPFRAHVQVASCPWNPQRRLARIAIKGRDVSRRQRPAANLVFLVDVSGSMKDDNKLPLLKHALKRLVRGLASRDRVAIVVYAGAAGLVLPSTPGTEKARIQSALDQLYAGGSTNGGAGIRLAYRIATEQFIEGGANRVILATDGDFNVGVTNRGDLTRLIEKKAKTGVFLSVLGFGAGNYKDDRMEELSNRGNGNYAYIDSPREARKVLVEQLNGTLVTIAKDVKIQVFFNPARVAGYRLIGYENRMLAKQDFNDDKKDAGEIGAGHAVTALYEIVPTGRALPGATVDPNPFVRVRKPARASRSRALLRLRLRYKQPDGDTSTLIEHDVADDGFDLADADRDFQWAASVAAFGLLLRDSPYKGNATWDLVLEMARPAVGEDAEGYRGEFLRLVQRARRLAANER